MVGAAEAPRPARCAASALLLGRKKARAALLRPSLLHAHAHSPPTPASTLLSSCPPPAAASASLAPFGASLYFCPLRKGQPAAGAAAAAAQEAPIWRPWLPTCPARLLFGRQLVAAGAEEVCVRARVSALRRVGVGIEGWPGAALGSILLPLPLPPSPPPSLWARPEAHALAPPARCAHAPYTGAAFVPAASCRHRRGRAARHVKGARRSARRLFGPHPLFAAEARARRPPFVYGRRCLRNVSHV